MSLRLFNIPSDVAFLPALVRAILAGNFPGDAPPPSLEDLPRWTILLPTRRAVRSLQRTFLATAGRDASPTSAREHGTGASVHLLFATRKRNRAGIQKALQCG